MYCILIMVFFHGDLHISSYYTTGPDAFGRPFPYPPGIIEN